MPILIDATVNGIPRPKGSMTAYSTRALVEPKTTKNWCLAVASEVAKQWQGGEPHDGPVGVELVFTIRGEVTGKPDIDKLCRAILDSISAGTKWGCPVLKDDSYVTHLNAYKQAGGYPGMYPGVRIIIRSRG